MHHSDGSYCNRCALHAAFRRQRKVYDMRQSFGHSVALLLPFLLLPAAVLAPNLHAQDTARVAQPPKPAASRIVARLRVVFRPPAVGMRRERALTRGGDGARALVPDARVDTLIPQTLREAPFVAVCAAGQPDSAWLKVRVGARENDVMVALRPGLNRLSLGAAQLVLSDGDVAEWSLSTRSGQVFLQEFIQRRVVRSTPTINALATNGIWYDALDRFVVESAQGIPMARERLDTFLTSVGETPCGTAGPPA